MSDSERFKRVFGTKPRRMSYYEEHCSECGVVAALSAGEWLRLWNRGIVPRKRCECGKPLRYFQQGQRIYPVIGSGAGQL